MTAGDGPYHYHALSHCTGYPSCLCSSGGWGWGLQEGTREWDGPALEFRIIFSDKNQLENPVLAVERRERGLVNFPVILVTLRKGCVWKVVFERGCYQHQNHLLIIIINKIMTWSSSTIWLGN